MKQKLLILAILLLLVPVSISLAQSSGNYINQRFSLFAGNSSTSASYSVTSIVGQPAAESSQSDSYEVISGFIPVLQQENGASNTIWLPFVLR